MGVSESVEQLQRAIDAVEMRVYSDGNKVYSHAWVPPLAHNSGLQLQG